MESLLHYPTFENRNKLVDLLVWRQHITYSKTCKLLKSTLALSCSCQGFFHHSQPERGLFGTTHANLFVSSLIKMKLGTSDGQMLHKDKSLLSFI